jgi:potassium efflux system protein
MRGFVQMTLHLGRMFQARAGVAKRLAGRDCPTARSGGGVTGVAGSGAARPGDVPGGKVPGKKILSAGSALIRQVRGRAVLRAVLLALSLCCGATPSLAQDNSVISGGARPGQPSVKVHADGSGALIPEVQRAPDAPPLALVPDAGPAAAGATAKAADTPVSGGFAPKTPVAKPIASGGASGGALDYQGWERMATRAESSISNTNFSNASLESLRAELTRWREKFQVAQTANGTRISTLKDQIAALGAVPADGTAEQPEIATRREELTAQMARLQAPGLAADEAYRRADGLIRELDRALRERQANELLKLWPNPLYPGNWGDALNALSQAATTLWLETAGRWSDPVARRRLGDNLLLILPLLAFAFAMLWRGRYWVDRLVEVLQGPSKVRGRRIWGLVASLGLVAVPVLGMLALAQALQLSAMLGSVGLQIAGVFGQIGLTLFTAVWLGVRIFPVTETPGALFDLPPERRAEGRLLTASFGALLSVGILRRAALSELDVTDAATSVMIFPIVLIGGLLLVRLGLLMWSAPVPGAEDGKPNYRRTLMSWMTRGVIFFGAVGPVLGAAGYISAASALVFPAILTLGLAALLVLAQRLVTDLYNLVMRTDGAREQDALAPVLISFALILAALPLCALIWGARVSDLTEIWTRFQEGYQLGATRISPTDFLFFAVVFAIGLSLTRVLQGAMKSSVLPRTGLDRGAQNAIVSGLGYAGIFVAALVAINSTGIDLSGLAIVAGALSVGIGFGLQNIVSNFVSGIILLIERPVSEGDWIEVGTVQGIVKAISVRSTRIQTFDRADVIVPNSDLISGRVTNWTRFSLTGRLIVAVTVPFTVDTRQVTAILRAIAEAQPLVLLSPPPQVVFMGFQAEMMLFEIRVILRDVNFQIEVRTEINHQIAERFRAAGVPFTSLHRDYLKRVADEAAAEVEAVAEEAANIAAVEAILDAPLPDTVRVRTAARKDAQTTEADASSKAPETARLRSLVRKDPETTDAEVTAEARDATLPETARLRPAVRKDLP